MTITDKINAKLDEIYRSQVPEDCLIVIEALRSVLPWIDTVPGCGKDIVLRDIANILGVEP